ncbi:MAG: hypothetical protein COW00_00550 [Bdellovibrio sp. CG12_big_fil_rev_8_21_14_0_65_39_13]|nr:MAG: hypothetical protein COW78_04490 [Bdellovibrio sp. CG22_combo_CG10-13_8_21_14_all_39_27]PIQ62973.1 MAG: hypothetical protein COW00_00550 [Bdellovibrio sp. CG12_big_fil_rev_8_21_14_0_65_39_13]PIR32648.1 MAG: hypothetical protein COV37_19040 [Bdellovibrio sp. CG11_big_fil_rev_8_21_14_0_20_39_38]
MLLILLTFFTHLAHAQWSMDLALAGQSQSIYRGAETWPEKGLMLGPGFSYDNQLFIQGPHVYWAFFDRQDDRQLILGIHYFDDNKPMISLGDHEVDYRNQRKNSLEFYSRGEYKFGWKNKFNLNFQIARDFISYEGLYSEIGAQAPLLPFTSLSTKISFAEKSTQSYLYGPGSLSGAGFSSLGLKFVWPFLPFEGIAMLGYDYSWVLKGINQHADYVRGRSRHQVFSLRIIAKIF